jgi:hypothetical protein
MSCIGSCGLDCRSRSNQSNQKSYAKPVVKETQEEVVRNFDGVDNKIASRCELFQPFWNKRSRDVCGVFPTVSDLQRQNSDRCIGFLTAHPDCKVMFHHPYVNDFQLGFYFHSVASLTLLLFQTNLSQGKVDGCLSGTEELGAENREGIEPDGSPLVVEDKPAFGE